MVDLQGVGNPVGYLEGHHYRVEGGGLVRPYRNREDRDHSELEGHFGGLVLLQRDDNSSSLRGNGRRAGEREQKRERQGEGLVLVLGRRELVD